MRCERYRSQIRTIARCEGSGGRGVQRHLRSCLRCQAEVVRERRLHRQLRSMRREPDLPSGLLDRILATIADAPPPTSRPSGSHRTAGVVAGAGALAGVIAVGFATRTGRRVLGLAG